MCSTNLAAKGEMYFSTEESNIIELTCRVEYRGNWPPAMRWRQNEGEVITTGVDIEAVPNQSVTSRFSAVATSNMSGSAFSCTLFFSAADKPSNTSANNVPEYSYTWKSPTLNVLCRYIYKILSALICHLLLRQ